MRPGPFYHLPRNSYEPSRPLAPGPLAERRDRLSEAEKQALERGPWRVRDYAAHQEIIAKGDRPNECCLVLEGFTGRSQDFADGRRQITGLQVPGDFVDLHGLFLHVIDIRTARGGTWQVSNARNVLRRAAAPKEAAQAKDGQEKLF